jgi:hypothetical protein
VRTTLLSSSTVVVAVFIAGTANAQPKACQARSECAPDEHCVDHACTSTVPYQEHSIATDEFRAYLGASIGAIFPAIWNNFGEGFQGALHVGAINKTVQLQLEVAPASSAIANLTNNPSLMTLFEVAGTVAVLPRISDMVSWIIRVGGGAAIGFGNINCFGQCPQSATSFTQGFGEIRLDFVGVTIRPSQHLLIEIDTPSFRILIPGGASNNGFGSGTVMLTWVTSVGISYVF